MNKKRNNKGFSLVELIVVIAIMAVLTGLAAMSISSVLGVAVKQCSREIKSAINETRVSTMGKDSVILTIKKESNGYYCVTQETDGLGTKEPVKTKVGRSNLEITYTFTDSSGNSVEKTLDGSNSITIEFNRASGAMKQVIDGASTGYCTQINIKKKSTEKILKLYPETGKVSLE